MRRTPYLRPTATTSSWPATLPVSAKPDGISTAPGIFFSPHLGQRLGHELRRDGEHRDVDVAGHVLDALVGLLAEDLVGARVDRIDRALVAAVDQILHDRVADLAVLGRGADHRHRVRLHDAVHLPHDLVLARPVAGHRRLEVEHHAHVGGGRAPCAWRTPDSGRARRSRESPRPAARRCTIMLASASRSTGGAPRTPRRISAAAMPSSIDSASSRVAGARRKVMSFSTSTSTPPRPKATSLPKAGSVTAPMMTSCPPVSICWTCTPSMLASGIVAARVGDDGVEGVPAAACASAHADQHAAGLGLVQDLRRDDLHHHREADRVGQLRGFARGSRPRPSRGTAMP